MNTPITVGLPWADTKLALELRWIEEADGLRMRWSAAPTKESSITHFHADQEQQLAA